jgi:transposase
MGRYELSIGRFTDLKDKAYYSDSKKGIIRDLYKSGLGPNEYIRRHNLKPSTVYGWIAKYKRWNDGNGVDTFHDSRGGRPRKLDSLGLADLRRGINSNTDGAAQKNTFKEFAKRATEIANETLERRGLAAQTVPLARSSHYRLKAEEDYSVAECQFKTPARIKAEADPRNFFTFAAMCQAYITDLGITEHHIYNWDATQFIIDKEGTMTVLKVKKEYEKSVPTAESSGELPIAIKYYHLHNAAGDVAKPVFCIADDTLGDHDLEWYLVPGLGLSTDPEANYGILAITKTRNCNDEFFNKNFLTGRSVCLQIKKVKLSTGYRESSTHSDK